MSPKANLIFLLAAFLCHEKLHAQEKPDLMKLMPKKFIDKWECFLGYSLTVPTGSDRASGSNPNIRTGYFAHSGYCVGIGLMHSMGKFELRSRIFLDQRGYVEKLWDNEPGRSSEFINEKK